VSAMDKFRNTSSQIDQRDAELGSDKQPESSLLANHRVDIGELIELIARSLRPIYPLETDCGFDELLRKLDQCGL